MSTIDRIFHYTTHEKLEKIMKQGILMPMSKPFEGESRKNFSKRVREIVRHNQYLVGLAEPNDEGWRECGLLEYLLKYTKGEVILEVPVLEPEAAFVREHAMCSPERSIKVCGENVWKYYHGQGQLNWRGTRISRMLWHDYFESTIPLSDYKGDFKAPEIWLYQPTLSEMIKVSTIKDK
jgi:hypothetical protein